MRKEGVHECPSSRAGFAAGVGRPRASAIVAPPPAPPLFKGTGRRVFFAILATALWKKGVPFGIPKGFPFGMRDFPLEEGDLPLE